jgi:hypothetical protein
MRTYQHMHTKTFSSAELYALSYVSVTKTFNVAEFMDIVKIYKCYNRLCMLCVRSDSTLVSNLPNEIADVMLKIHKFHGVLDFYAAQDITAAVLKQRRSFFFFFLT